MVEAAAAKLRKLVAELGKLRGRHTELVSVFIPAGYSIIDVINQVRNERGTAENIKSKSTRKNVVDALTKIEQHLKLYKATPPHGLAVFCGNVAETEGVTDIKLWAIEPPEPLKVKMYWCDQHFELKPLQDMDEEKELYGLVVMDTQEATIGVLRGKAIQVLRRLESIVPGKTAKGGQCLSLETLVPLSDGNIVKMSELYENARVKAADFNTFSVADSPTMDIWRTQKSEFFKIVTRCPRIEIETSAEHAFFVIRNGEIVEKVAEELKVGDILIMPEKITVRGKLQALGTNYFSSFEITPVGINLLREQRKKKGFSQERLAALIGRRWQGTVSGIERGKRTFKQQGLKDLEKLCETLDIDFCQFKKLYLRPHNKVRLPTILTEQLAQIIGYFVGDGNYDKNRIVFSESSKELAEYYKDMLVELFKCSIGCRFRKSKNYYDIKVYSQAVERFFRGQILNTKNSLSTAIPEKILKSPDKVLAAFLKGLWDADGYISDKVSLGINNKTLAQQVQLALLRFGIIASLYDYDAKRNPYSKNHRYTVEIGERESLIRFENHIGSSSTKKAQKLRRFISQKADKSAVRRFAFSGKKVRDVLESYGMMKQQFPHVMGFFYDKQLMSKSAFTRSVLNNITDEDLYLQLKQATDCPFIPVIIKRIERYQKNTPMIDIEVGNSNFIANGLFVHNSAVRFARVREGLVNDFYKQVAEQIRALMPAGVKGIVLGGPGPSKEDFWRGDYLMTDVKNKILGLQSVSYTDEAGLHELVERSKELLAEASVIREKALLQKFFTELQKDSGLVTYGIQPVLKALEAGAVETLLISEGLDWKAVELACGCGWSGKRYVRTAEVEKQACPNCGRIAGVIGQADIVEAFEELAKSYGSAAEVVSTETREGGQLAALGGIAAILRYRYEKV